MLYIIYLFSLYAKICWNSISSLLKYVDQKNKFVNVNLYITIALCSILSIAKRLTLKYALLNVTKKIKYSCKSICARTSSVYKFKDRSIHWIWIHSSLSLPLSESSITWKRLDASRGITLEWWFESINVASVSILSCNKKTNYTTARRFHVFSLNLEQNKERCQVPLNQNTEVLVPLLFNFIILCMN